jgi:Rrf2 family transcriptional regulator, nitric oxide-sensitive transcriptional repressor
VFSQTVEYALRVVVYLASLKGVPATTKQIAGVTKVPEGYLAKVLQGLGRAGLIQSQRGLHGGSVLALPPDKLSVYDVIEAVQPIQRIRLCPLNLKSHGTKLCSLHKRLDDAMAMVERAFREASLADLLAECTSSKPLCETEEPPRIAVSAVGLRRK